MSDEAAPTADRHRPVARAAAERARRRRRWQVSAVVATGVAIVVGVVVAAAVLADDGATGTAEEADFDLPALDDEGARVRLADYRGTPVVVNFFASWCPTCDEELPDFDRMADALEGQVEFVFVNSQDDGDWRPMAERNDILDQTLARDLGPDMDELYRAVGGQIGLPITAFYSADGELVETVFQGMTHDFLAETIETNFGVDAPPDAA